MDTNHPILRRIRETDEALAANAEKRRLLDLDDARLRVRREAYADAYDLMGGGGLPEVAPPRPLRATQPTDGRRGISPVWRKLLGQAARAPGAEFGVDDVMRVAETLDSDAPSRSAIRSQLANYANRGTVERVRNGVFCLTAKGAAEIDIEFSDEASASDENTPPEGGVCTGEVSPSPDEAVLERPRDQRDIFS